MNIVSVTVSAAMMGTLMPGIMTMAIAPSVAQLKAKNFAVAETAAVVFAATYEGTTDIPVATDTCTTEAREGTKNAYSVTCTHGSGQFVQSVTRAFRLAVPENDLVNGDGASSSRQFEFETPTRYSGHQCPTYDPWGVYGYNDQHYAALGGACTPDVAWSQVAYQFSNPDAWLYDINGINGWGDHPDYYNVSCDDNDGNNGHGNSGGYDCSNPGNSGKNKNKNKNK